MSAVRPGIYFANEAFYIITEGGFKFRGILQNDKVSAAIFDPYTDMSDIHRTTQIYGTSELYRTRYRRIPADSGHEKCDSGDAGYIAVGSFLVKIKPQIWIS